MKNIYLDNAATTKCFDEVFDIIKKCNDEDFYNPSATYSLGVYAKKSLDTARVKILNALHGVGGKLYFTSSATESNNTVIFGVHLRAGQKVLISKAEHPSIYVAAHALEKKGIIVEDIPLSSLGTIDEEAFFKMLDKNVALISIIHVSNETGAINDIERLCKIAKQFNPQIIFHSDGVQAFGKIGVNLRTLGVDLYTISAHKLYAPRGIAGLWVKDKISIDPLLFGGGQEMGLRSSTENLSGAMAFAYSAKKVTSELDENLENVKLSRQNLIDELKKSKIAGRFIINSPENSSPYILSISFSKIKGEVLMNALVADGIFVSTGSACSSKKAGNRTLEAMGLESKEVVGSIRISFSAYEKYDEKYIAECIEKNVLKLSFDDVRKVR